jgi:serine/threonine protein kinase
MGEIFLARLEGAAGFEKLFVIKRILPHLAGDSRFREMLISEAQIAANMSHANICQVYELDETDGQLYIVMEYLEGTTVLALLRKYSRQKRQLPLGFIAGVVHQVAEGLHYAHELGDRNGGTMGIVHRDITPSNLFLTRSGVAKVHDFGVAKVKNSATTEAGTVKGKFAYMAPEQLVGAAVDRRADIFALGVVTGEMIAIRRLFQRKTDYLTFQAVVERPLPDFHKLRPGLPEAMVAVLNQALAHDPAERYATVRELATAVTDALGYGWSQAEISELVETDFSEELRSHHDEISAAIRRSLTRTRTMPVIRERAPDPATEDHFAFEPSLEHNRTPVSQVTNAAVADAVSSPHRLPSVRRRPIAAISAAAAATVLLAVIVIHGLHSPSNPAAAAPAIAPVAQPVEPSRAASVAGMPRAEPYSEVIHANDAKLVQCVTLHDERLPEDTRAILRIGADGRARSVSFTPALVEHSALAHCIRDVLTTAVYPAATVEQELALAVHR